MIIHFSIISNDIPASSKKKATNYCIRFGHSLRSAIGCQRKWLIACSLRNNAVEEIGLDPT